MYVVSLTGDRYQIGFQHGRRLRGLIHYAVRNRCRFYKDRGRPSPVGLQRRASAIESNFPELVAEMRGIADGSRLPLHDILIYNMSPIPNACSNVAFLPDCRPILGHVNDDAGGSLDVAFCIRPTQGPEILLIGQAGSVGAAAALNSSGLAMSHSCARSGGLRNREAYLNLPLLRRLLIDHSNNCQEARDFLSTHCFASGADNIICVDHSGSAFVAEKLPTMVEFREPTGRGVYCTGRALTAAIRSAVEQDKYEEECNCEIGPLLAREGLFAWALAKPERALSLRFMRQLLQHSDDEVEVSNELSTWAAALSPASFEMWIADRFPCHSKFARIRRASKCRFI